MLIKFKVDNFRSFGKTVELSCLATPERGHRERIFNGPLTGLRILTVGAIYGANASGKSNLYRAVRFARDLIVDGLKPDAPIPVQPFRLDPAYQTAPSEFSFEVLVGDKVFAYRFRVTAEAVIEESLTEIRAASERLLFSRNHAEDSETKWDFSYLHSLGLKSEELQFIAFIGKGTSKNQLFLHEAHARNIKYFNGLWDWFRDSLVLIDPRTTIPGLEFHIDEETVGSFATRLLRNADLGIDRLGTEEVSMDSLGLAPAVRQELENECKEGGGVTLKNRTGDRFVIRRIDGDLKAARLLIYLNTKAENNAIAFDLGEASDGTQRIVDLLPAFHDLVNTKKDFVVFIDELDRSLHSRLTRSLIEGYFSSRQTGARTQLLFTTHDTTLLDHELFRKDEVWLMDKNEKGESELSSLGDFKLRSDKRLMKDYLLGRFGGVPNIHQIPLRPVGILTGALDE